MHSVDDAFPAAGLFGDEEARNSGHSIALKKKKLVLEFEMETRTVRK
jgi:hypothetical protein